MKLKLLALLVVCSIAYGVRARQTQSKIAYKKFINSYAAMFGQQTPDCWEQTKQRGCMVCCAICKD
jgi:hypothetical protein